MSLAQSIIDLQDVKTYFMRQLITNMGKMNNPRTVINDNVNLSDVLSKRHDVIRVKGTGDPRAAVATEPTTPIIGQVIPLLDLIDNQKEGRSGITRNSMGLDADILAKSTEGAFMGAIEKAEQRVEFIVRVFAETVFKSIFLKIHHLLLSYGDAKEMKLNGEWVVVDPAEWRKRESMTVNVGLGLGNRRQKIASAQMIIAEQDKDIQMGLDTVDPQRRYNARRLLVESSGEKSVDKYFVNPANIPPKPPAQPQLDPNLLMIQSNERIEQGKRQNEMAKLNQEYQVKAAEFQFKQAEASRKQQFEQIELMYKREIETLKAQISQDKNDNDVGRAELQARIDQLEAELKDKQESEKLVMDKYKADLDAEVKILLKSMDGGKEPDQVAQEQSLDVIAAVISEMNRPKRIIRDDDGLPVGVEPYESN